MRGTVCASYKPVIFFLLLRQQVEGVFKGRMCGNEATGIKGPLQPFTTRSSPRAPPDTLIMITTALCSLFASEIKKIKEEEKDDEVPLDTRIRWLT